MSTNLSNLIQQSSPHTFFELLSRYRIAIPCLQRHYVQGEATAKAQEVLNNFLNELLVFYSQDAPKQLHFLFGPLDTDGADTFQPVDGQQRLTTLWLLSRYAVAWLNDPLERASLLHILSRFTYSERIHAERFLQRLTEERRDDTKWRNNPSTEMQKCGILNGGWREDKTVAAMLNALDAIASLWKKMKLDAETLLTWIWQKLTFHIHMEYFSDDLYMKMNARGIPLTQWEKVKGKFAELFDKECNFSERIEKLSNAFFVVMENCLPDDASLENCLPDDAFLAFFGRIAHYIQSEKSSEVLEEQKVNELTILAESTWRGDKCNLPYTPFGQFKAGDISKESQLSMLDLMDYLLLGEAKGIYLPEWDGVEKCLLVKAVFHPENKHQRDLSLVLFEYFMYLKRPNNLYNFELSVRLFWNILGEGNVTPDENAPYKRIEVLRDKFIKSASSQNIYMNTNRSNLSDNVAWQYREEYFKMNIYQNTSEWPKEKIFELQQAETFLHGQIKIVLSEPTNSKLCQAHITVLNRLNTAWRDAFNANDNQRKKFLISCVMMAMPYWPDIDEFPFADNYETLRILLKKNEVELASSLLDFLYKNPNATPKEILENNQLGFCSRVEYQKTQPWRRDWQANLLWVIDNEQIWEKRVQYHRGSDYFYLYQKGNIKLAKPLNDYRFDFICNNTMKKALNDFYKSVSVHGTETEIEMTMNDSSTRSIAVESDSGHKRNLYFYPDHIAVTYLENGIWSSQKNVVFDEKEGKSIFEQNEFTSRITEFFATIKAAIQNPLE